MTTWHTWYENSLNGLLHYYKWDDMWMLRCTFFEVCKHWYGEWSSLEDISHVTKCQSSLGTWKGNVKSKLAFKRYLSFSLFLYRYLFVGTTLRLHQTNARKSNRKSFALESFLFKVKIVFYRRKAFSFPVYHFQATFFIDSYMAVGSYIFDKCV